MTAAELVIPADRIAEDDLAGVMVSSAAGYALAASRLAPGDFYQPSRGRVMAACAELGHLAGSSIDVERERICEVARIADMPIGEVRALVRDRCVQFDRAGHLARRVERAARARRVMAGAAVVFNRLAGGERIDELDVPGELRELLEAMA